MSAYPIVKSLKDGGKITIREMVMEDAEKSLAFFKSLPYEERQYLRMDVSKMESIKIRMNPGPFSSFWRIVAEQDDKIVADATVKRYPAGWKRHVSEIRCIVHPDFQQKGLGRILIRELFQKILQDKGEMAFCEVIPAQKSAIKVLERLGFELSLVRKNHVKDINGKTHDLCIYSKDVVQMWDLLQHHLDMYDMEYPRT